VSYIVVFVSYVVMGDLSALPHQSASFAGRWTPISIGLKVKQPPYKV
jgi:hypothetical protein